MAFPLPILYFWGFKIKIIILTDTTTHVGGDDENDDYCFLDYKERMMI